MPLPTLADHNVTSEKITGYSDVALAGVPWYIVQILDSCVFMQVHRVVHKVVHNVALFP